VTNALALIDHIESELKSQPYKPNRSNCFLSIGSKPFFKGKFSF